MELVSYLKCGYTPGEWGDMTEERRHDGEI